MGGAQGSSGAAGKHKVTVYSTEFCGYCKLAKQYFKENNVAFEEKMVDKDEVARDEMIQKSGQYGVPVIDIDGKLVIGYDKPQLAQLLDLA